MNREIASALSDIGCRDNFRQNGWPPPRRKKAGYLAGKDLRDASHTAYPRLTERHRMLAHALESPDCATQLAPAARNHSLPAVGFDSKLSQHRWRRRSTHSKSLLVSYRTRTPFH